MGCLERRREALALVEEVSDSEFGLLVSRWVCCDGSEKSRCHPRDYGDARRQRSRM